MSKKVKLTDTDIENILNFIQPNPYIPKETAMIIVEKTKKSLRNQLIGKEIYPKMIGQLYQQIQSMYFSTLVQPGESVGIIMAQSIGEKQTQSSLNSVDWKEQILYTNGETPKVEPIGMLIDRLLKINSSRVLYLENNTEYLEVKNSDMFIPSIDEHGKCNWRRIEAVTKHFPEGKLVKVTTESGRTVTATQALSFLVWDGYKFIPKNGSELKIGDRLPTTIRNHPTSIVKDYCQYGENAFKLDKQFGFFMGTYLASGTLFNKVFLLFITDDNIRKSIIDYCIQFHITNYISDKAWVLHAGVLIPLFESICNVNPLEKQIPDMAYISPMDFITGLLDGLFSENGIVKENTISISFHSENLIIGISNLLSRFGILGKISDNYTLTIEGVFAKKFSEQITLTKTDKQEKLTLIDLSKEEIINKDVHQDKIISIEFVDGTTRYVYDFTVEGTRNFQLYNCLNMRDTFHKAGSSDKQPVVSKFSELLNATNKPKSPSYYIYFKKGNTSVPELRQLIGHNLVQLTFKRLIKNWKICIDKKPENWYDAFFLLYRKENTFTDCISMEINMDILFEYKLTMFEIADVINREYIDALCIFSPDCLGKIDIYFDTKNIDLSEEKLVFITRDNIREIYLEEVVHPILENISLCGIQGIMNIFFIQEGKEWLVETENSHEKTIGSIKFKNKGKSSKKEKIIDSTRCFKKVLAHPIVDVKRTISNNIWDIYYIFGIEAVRQYMIDEFSKIMDGINTCHVMLLVDKMTFTGTISSISRYTMRREESGPLCRASFEETLDNFLKAGVFGQEEPTEGVSASIICGKRASIGTGMCDLAIDMEKICLKTYQDSSK